MFKKVYCVVLLLCLLAFANAQVASTKLDLRLYKRLAQGKINGGSKQLLVRGDLNKIKALTIKMGGIYKYGVGRIASVQIPEKNLVAFANDVAVEQIENTSVHGVALMDTARIRNNIDSAYFGFAPLTDSLSGRNVIIGVIDQGVYWKHQDFTNADGTTRFKYIWDQGATGGSVPTGYGYGNEYNWVDINNGNCQEIDPANDFGHGTIVTGIASGNSRSLQGTSREGLLRGAAPESQIIFVKLDPSGDNFLTNVSDAISYIYQKAAALCLPAVINTSVGTYYGSHDGIDITSEIIDSLITLRNDSFACENLGRVLVASAGNGGNIRHHLSYTLSTDSNNPGYTLYSYSPYVPGFYFDFWADTANFSNAYFTIGATDTLGNDYGTITNSSGGSYLNVQRDFGPLTNGVSVIRSNYYIGSGLTPITKPLIAVTLDEGRYHVEVLDDSVATQATYLSLKTYGVGSFDGWTSSNPELGLYSCDMVDSLAPSIGAPRVFISDPNYHHPDSLKTIVSSWQCSDKVITVGNYCNRAGYFDRDSLYVDLTLPANSSQVPGKIFLTSSIGPTRDFRLKPDVMSTGSTTISTGDSIFISQATSAANRMKVYITVKHIRNGGTSMASPLVSGIAALYLQKRPTAPWNEVKAALICTATSDSFTGPTPNYSYGNGKVNAFAAVTRATCITYGPTDTACLNYNPLATIDTGSCVPKLYGCMDTTASNYNPAANVSSGGCVYTGIKKLKPGTASLQVTPNPFNNQTVFSLTNNGVAFKLGEIEIVNQLGQNIDVIPVSPNTSNYVYHNNKLASGIYLYRLKLDNKIADSGKIVVE